MVEKKDSNERRRSIRFPVPLRVQVTLAASLGCMQKGITEDVSRQGLRLLIHDFNLKKGAGIDLKIFIPKHKESIAAKGEIVWAKAREGRWEMGAKIDKIDKEVKSEILEYAYNLWRWKQH